MALRQINFGLIGSGRVATHLALALQRGGAICLGVYSRTLSHAQALATKLHCPAYSSVGDLATRLYAEGASWLIISVSDNAIAPIAQQLPSHFAPMVVHTSGSTSIEVLNHLPYYGVLYPMQTFSIEREVEVSRVPFFTEANSPEGLQQLDSIVTEVLGAKSTHLSSSQRGRLHLASVFACNFVNHMYASAAEVLAEANIPFAVMHPLMQETLAKALSHPPYEVQTGPAVRGDSQTINKHLELLNHNPRLQKLYAEVSSSITQLYE